MLQLVKNLNLSVYFKHHEIKKEIESFSDRSVSEQSIRGIVHSSLTAFSSKKLNSEHTAFKTSSQKEQNPSLHYKHKHVKVIYENNP